MRGLGCAVCLSVFLSVLVALPVYGSVQDPAENGGEAAQGLLEDMQLEEIQQGLRQQVLDLPEEDAIRAREILEGGEAQDANEAALCGQVSQNRRLLLRCQETDKRISMGLDSRRSFYSKYR